MRVQEKRVKSLFYCNVGHKKCSFVLVCYLTKQNQHFLETGTSELCEDVVIIYMYAESLKSFHEISCVPEHVELKRTNMAIFLTKPRFKRCARNGTLLI